MPKIQNKIIYNTPYQSHQQWY